VSVKTLATDWDRTGTTNGDTGGDQIEAWLFTEAQKELRSWFNNYEPLDTSGDDYVGLGPIRT
jgi:hypothetical protein